MRTFLAVILTALLFTSATDVFSQNKTQVELFNLDVLNFYSTEGTKSRVDIYMEIPLSRLEFKRSKTDKSKYVSKFDLTIDVKYKNGETAYNNVSKEEVTTKETGQTYLSQNAQILTRSIFLPPGEYDVKVSIYEQNTKTRSEREKEVTVKDFSASPLSISDVMIVSKISSTDGKKLITPNVSRNTGDLDTFYLFYYIYQDNLSKPIEVKCRILDSDNKEIYSGSEILDPAEGLSYQNQVFMKVPSSNISAGKYTVEISAASEGYTSALKSSFMNENTDFPLSLKDIDKLIDQLQYIAKDEEMDNMREGKTDAEKQKRFLDFWKKKDPTASSKRNEVMQEYYKRLLSANKLFSTSYVEGWRTDMGMVYIIFGEPSNVERHPYEMDTKPYEIWDYYNIQKQFVFVDNSGFGDYRLITPIWDTFVFQRP